MSKLPAPPNENFMHIPRHLPESRGIVIHHTTRMSKKYPASDAPIYISANVPSSLDEGLQSVRSRIMTPEQIRQRLFLSNPEPDLVEAFDQILGGRSATCPVLDTSGNPLVESGIYKLGDRTVKIRGWEFGAGNILDKYYRVYYTDDKLRDTFLVVEARYPNGVFGDSVYPSQLVSLGVTQ